MSSSKKHPGTCEVCGRAFKSKSKGKRLCPEHARAKGDTHGRSPKHE